MEGLLSNVDELVSTRASAQQRAQVRQLKPSCSAGTAAELWATSGSQPCELTSYLDETGVRV